MANLVIDPITRIEGHLKIEVEIENGKVKDAWSSGTLFRGFEIILQGRDPRDAWHITQRICGVCPDPHGTASLRSMEDSFKIKPPNAGRIIQNLILGTNFLHSHILHFYHLHALDFVDVVSALKAAPETAYLKKVQDKLKAFVDSGQLGPFANGYWGHPEYKLTPEINLLATAHYLEALDMQAKASNMGAIFGGIHPHQRSMIAGGVTCRPNVRELAEYKFRLLEVKDFIDNTYVPDVLAVAPAYLDWAGIGAGHGNFLAWGAFPDKSFDPLKQSLPMGAIYDGAITDVKDASPDEVTEFVKHSWYTESSGNLNPAKGKTEPAYDKYNIEKRYSWIKAPRLNDKPMEVGPLARIAVAYGRGNKRVVELVDGALEALGVAGKPEVLVSTLGRIAARALEAKYVGEVMVEWVDELIGLIKAGEYITATPFEVPDSAEGTGLTEAPRGAVLHYNQIEDGRIKNYQACPATVWNACPRDDKEVRGPMEEALIGTPVADPKQPLEILRVVHSFDP